MEDNEKYLNGFGIISFNLAIDNSSIKYEYYNFNNTQPTKKDIQIETHISKSINFNNDLNTTNDNKENIDRFWILIDNNNDNKLIIKNIYTLLDFDNFFSGPFDSQVEVIKFLENFKDINYEIEFQ